MRYWLFISILLIFPCALSAQHGAYYGQRASLFDVLPIDSADIIMLGNSLTDGCEWHELFNNPHIKNRGISGDIIAGVNDRLETIANGHPRKIFLMIGINDISHDLPADSIAQSILNAIDRLHKLSPDTRLYVQSLLPVNPAIHYRRLAGKEPVILRTNAILCKAAAEHNYTFIDLYTHFASEDSQLLDPQHTNDGLHLLGSGYLLWGKLLQPYIDE